MSEKSRFSAVIRTNDRTSLQQKLQQAARVLDSSHRPIHDEAWDTYLTAIDRKTHPSQRQESTMTYGSALVLVLSLVSQVSDKPTVKYDKFKDRTHIAIDLKELPGEDGYSNITLATGYKGKGPQTFDGSVGILLAFYRSGKGWKYLSHHDVELMCGSDHIPVRNPSYSSNTDDGECNESLAVHFTLNTLKKFLQNNEDWDVKLGWEQPFSLNARDRAKMMAFVKFLEKNGGA